MVDSADGARVPAATLVSFVEARRAQGVFDYEYECLFIAETHTRPSMEFSVYDHEIASAEWKSVIESRVAGALAQAAPGEKVFFELIC